MTCTTPITVPSDQEKAAVWNAYHEKKPIRVPMTLGTNFRVVILDPAWNPKGYTFEQVANDPQAHVEMALAHQRWRGEVLGQCSDEPSQPPEAWTACLNTFNIYEAAYFGASIDYSPDQVPDTIPPFADEDHKQQVFEVDIEHPMENSFTKKGLDFWKQMEQVCREMQYQGRPVRLIPWAVRSSDGPVTVACNLRGADNFMMDLVADEEYADRLLAYLTRAAIVRRQAFEAYWGDRLEPVNGLADDSCVLISNEMYAQRVLPHHRMFYEAAPGVPRTLHMCGDATRLFPMIRRELNVDSFDTGFPVNHGLLRTQLGDDVQILGGPEVAILMNGSPDQVYQRTQSILQSGVMQGGRFILREGNNLPPHVPMANLQAMYQACLEHGRYAPEATSMVHG